MTPSPRSLKFCLVVACLLPAASTVNRASGQTLQGQPASGEMADDYPSGDYQQMFRSPVERRPTPDQAWPHQPMAGRATAESEPPELRTAPLPARRPMVDPHVVPATATAPRQPMYLRQPTSLTRTPVQPAEQSMPAEQPGPAASPAERRQPPNERRGVSTVRRNVPAGYRAVSAEPSLTAEPSSTDVRDLVLGDGYQIIVQRRGLKKVYNGRLVKENDHWIVLASLLEGRSETGVPVLKDVPYAKRMFRNVGIGRWTSYHWIPRSAAQIQGRILASEQVELPILPSDTPPADAQFKVEVVQDGKVVDGQSTVTLRDEVLICHQQYTEITTKRFPVLGSLPVVGGTFTSKTTTELQKDLQFPWDDVFCLTQLGE